jgi:magnesium-transporting ATPase (P-type)
LLLRGSTLQNTDWVIAVVLYPGKLSKIMLNSKASHKKKSFLEKNLDRYFLYSFLFMVII